MVRRAKKRARTGGATHATKYKARVRKKGDPREKARRLRPVGNGSEARFCICGHIVSDSARQCDSASQSQRVVEGFSQRLLYSVGLVIDGVQLLSCRFCWRRVWLPGRALWTRRHHMQHGVAYRTVRLPGRVADCRVPLFLFGCITWAPLAPCVTPVRCLLTILNRAMRCTGYGALVFSYFFPHR